MRLVQSIEINPPAPCAPPFAKGGKGGIFLPSGGKVDECSVVQFRSSVDWAQVDVDEVISDKLVSHVKNVGGGNRHYPIIMTGIRDR